MLFTLNKGVLIPPVSDFSSTTIPNKEDLRDSFVDIVRRGIEDHRSVGGPVGTLRTEHLRTEIRDGDRDVTKEGIQTHRIYTKR